MNKESVQIHMDAVPDDEKESPSTPRTPLGDNHLVLTTSSQSSWATPGSVLGSPMANDTRGFSSPGTPGTELSVRSVTSSTWATPDALEATEKVYSFREIISMPYVPDGQESAPKAPNGLAESKVVLNGDRVRTGVTPTATPDCNESVSSFASHSAATPNTPRIVVGDVSIISPDVCNVTVYEKTPYVATPLNDRSPAVKIIGAIDKIAQTVIGEPEKGSSRTYIVPEETVVVGKPAKTADDVIVCATPFVTGSTSREVFKSTVNVIEAVDGPTQPAPAAGHKISNTVAGFADDSERLVSEEEDCDDLLGGFLVRPCPSMRPLRRMFAKGCVIGLLVVVAAFIVVMFLINRS